MFLEMLALFLNCWELQKSEFTNYWLTVLVFGKHWWSQGLSREFETVVNAQNLEGWNATLWSKIAKISECQTLLSENSAGHTGSFHKYHDDGLQQAVFIKKVVNFWPKQLN